jgi:hypothetical protein
MPEPIDIVPGVYTKPGGREVTGLCIMIDNQDAQWEVTTSDHHTTIIKIKRGAHWKARVFTDPKTGKPKLQLFREGANLNSLVLTQFIHPTEEVYTPNANAANNETSDLKIFYTTPEDVQPSPIKIKAP